MTFELVGQSGDPVNPLSIDLGRTLALYGLTAAVVFKFAIEAQVGARSYLAAGTFTAYSNDRYAAEGLARKLSYRTYSISYWVKWAALATLPLGGWVTALAATVLALWFLVVEIAYDYKHHTIFLGLYAGLIAFTGPGGLLLSATAYGQTLIQPEVLATVVLCLMYLSSAIIKLESPQFIDGSVLRNLFDYWTHEAHRMRRMEVLLPKSAVRVVSELNPRARAQLFRITSRLTIAGELALIPLIVIPVTWMFAVALAVVMHLAFNVLFLWRLIPFYVAVISLYCMVPPWR